MRRPQQFMFENLGPNTKYFGGSLLRNSNAKTKRPVSTKRAMHTVLRSSMARGPKSFLPMDRKIKEIMSRQGRKHGVKIYRQAIGGNHLHLVILPRSREAYNGFIRSISGLIARLMLKAERGSPNHTQNHTKFWDKRPFTRIVEWGREFRGVSNYLLQNTLEAIGFIPYQPRRTSTYLRASGAG